MPDINGNLSVEELAAKKEMLKQKAIDLGATEEEVLIASRETAPEIVNDDIDSVEQSPVDITKQASDIMPKGNSEAATKDSANDLSLIKQGMDEEISSGEAYTEAYKNLTVADLEETVEASVKAFASDITSDMNEVLMASVSAEPSNAVFYGDTARTIKETESLYEGISGRNKALSDLYSNEGVFSRSRRETESRMNLTSHFKKWAEDRSLLQNIWDGVSLLEPISFTLDANDITKLDPTAKGDGAAGKLKDIIAGWQAIDPELRSELAPKLIEKLADATNDNEFKMGAFVGLLNDPDFVSNVNFTETLDAIELGGMVPVISAPLKLAKLAQKALSRKTNLRDMKNPEAALNKTDSIDSDPLTVAQDKDPTNWENNIIGTNNTDGLAEEAVKMRDRIEANVAGPMRDLAKSDALIPVDSLTAAEKEAAIAKKIEDLKTTAKKFKSSIVEAAPVDKTDTGFVIRYRLKDKEGKETEQLMDFSWTLDDAGSLVASNATEIPGVTAAMGSKFLSPDTLFRSLDQNLVDDVTFAGFQSSVIFKEMSNIYKKAEASFKNIPMYSMKNGKMTKTRGDARESVNELLLTGDETGQVFKLDDLISGNVQTPSGMRKYTMEEAESYFSMRAIMDEAHGIQNNLVRRKLEFLGYKEATWLNPTTGASHKAVAKPFKDGRGWAADTSENILAPGMKDHSILKRGEINIKQSIEEGWVPVSFLEPVKVGNKTVKYGLMRAGDNTAKVGPLPNQVLQKAPGYVTRITKPGYYFVTDLNSGKTIARAPTKQDAEQWAAAETAKALANKKPGDKIPRLQARRDRELTAVESVLGDADSYGGLYTGARSSEKLTSIADETGQGYRMAASQSIARMLDNLANEMPINEYRFATINRWKETAKTLLLNNGAKSGDDIFRKIDDPKEWMNVKFDSTMLGENTTKMLESSRDYIASAMKVKHNDERTWSNMMMSVADRIPNGKVRDKVVDIASTDPVQALKGATFNAYLGWFNPRQLYVQMQNAALAVSMYPGKAVTAIPEALIQRAFLYNGSLDKDLIAKAANGVADKDGVADIVVSLEQFKKSGLRDSIMRHGDYDAVAGGLSEGSLGGMRGLASKGRIFFQEGESMGRLISWNIARKNWIKANPGKNIDDLAIKDIAKDTLRMAMNMQRENQAWWQRNAFTSIPTQFLQVQAKVVENVVGGLMGSGKWSQKEAAFALGGQLALYGTIGVPMAEQVSAMWKEGRAPGQAEYAVENPQWNTMLDHGMMGVLFNSMGFSNDFSTPGNMLAGMDDNILFTTLKSFADVALGNSTTMEFKAPALGVAARGTDALLTTADAMRDIVVAPSLETVGDSVFKSLDAWGSITSTWSNARKHLFLNKLGGIQNKAGDVIIDAAQVQGESLQTQVASAMGIPMYSVGDYYEKNLWSYDRSLARKETSRTLGKIFNEYRLDNNKEKFKANYSLLLSEYEDQPLVRSQIVKTFLKDLTNPRSLDQKANQRFILDYIKSGGAIGTKPFFAPEQTQGEQ